MKTNCRGAIILGMHDAIVSLTGLIAGLFFAFTDSNIIIISCIISSITASLSMGAANYLATKTINHESAMRSAICTFAAYMITCVLLILPFFSRPHLPVPVPPKNSTPHNSSIAPST